ncbi:MAG TPA: D-aminoacyl-tRNA deacylase [Terriglobales bacterium]|nr:D-aminoacyl-tRNA deacylase [Terriglobales bacterium]
MQRVTSAKVEVADAVVGAIGAGYVVLVGVETGDAQTDVEYICRKIVGLRLWTDEAGKMNLPLGDRAVLLVSQFTLLGDTARGMRPSFDRAARPEEARRWYESLIEQLRGVGVTVATGIFQADMRVELVNDGPVTVLIDSRV